MRERKVLFWDFDGVIKESVAVKTAAFVRLFEPFGPAIAKRVREHHERNGGMSRLQKIPLYLEWAGCTVTPEEVARYCELFSAAVLRSVIESPWVPGAREYLEANHGRQHLCVITATPQGEIERILHELGITPWFREVCGAPLAKADAIASVLERWRFSRESALVIGDSQADYDAAMSNRVEFLLRRTPLNQELQRVHLGLQCESFINE